MLDMSSEHFFGSGDGLMFSVYDYDALGQDDLLGRVFGIPGGSLGREREAEGVFSHSRKGIQPRKPKAASLLFACIHEGTGGSQKKKFVGAFAGEAFVPIRQHQPANVLEADGGLLPGNDLLKQETRKTKAGSREVRMN
jgi:hypothetical protein